MRILLLFLLFLSNKALTQSTARLALPIGHTGPITSAVFSPDGKLVLTASEDKTARIYDVATGKELYVFSGYQEYLTSATFSPNGKFILTSGDVNKILVYDVFSGKQVKMITCEGVINSVVFSPNSKLILTSNGDSTASIYNLTSGKQLRVLRGHSGFISSAVFSPDGKLVLTAGTDATARIFSVSSGKQLRILTGHSGAVNSAVFSPDGNLILTASQDYTARVYYVNSGTEVHTLSGHSSGVNTAVFSPDGKHVLTSSDDETARVFDVSSGNQLHVLTGHDGGVVSAVFSPDEKLVLTTGEDFTSRVFDVKTGNCLEVLVTGLVDPSDYFPVFPSVFSPDGKWLLYSFYKKIKIKKVVKTEIQHFEGVSSFKMGGDGKHVLMLKTDTSARVIDLESRKEISVFEDVYIAEFNADCKLLLTISADQTARIYHLDSGKEMQLLSLPKEVVSSAQFSPDGKSILVVSEHNTVRIYDVFSGKELHNWQENGLYYACFNPTGNLILTQEMNNENGDNFIRIYDWNSRRFVNSFTGSQSPIFAKDGQLLLYNPEIDSTKIFEWKSDTFVYIKSIENQIASFSHDGKFIATIDDNLQVRIIDFKSGDKIQVLEMFLSDFNPKVDFSFNGKYLIIVERNIVHICDLTSGKEIQRLIGQSKYTNSAIFSPDSKLVITLDSDNTATFSKLNLSEYTLLSGHALDVHRAEFSSSNQLVLVASSDVLTIFDVFSGRLVQKIALHDKWINSMCLSPDHKWLLTNEPESNSSRIYQISSGHELKLPYEFYLATFPKVGSNVLVEELDVRNGVVYDLDLNKELFVFNDVICAVLNPNGESIMIIEDSIARVYETSTGIARFTISNESQRFVSCNFSPNGQQIFIAEDSSLRIFDVKTGKLQQKFYVNDISKVSFNPNGGSILIESFSSTEAYLFDIFSGKKLHQLNLMNLQYEFLSPNIEYLTLFSHNGQLLLWWASDSTFHIYDIEKHKEQVLNIHFVYTTSVTLSPNGKLILILDYRSNPRIYDVTSGKKLHVLVGHTGEIYSAVFSPDGKYIMTTASDHKTILWDVVTGKQLYTRIQLEGNDWLVYDEYNRFDGTPGAIDYLYLTCGLEIIDLAQVKDSLWVPGLAEKIMNGEPILINDHPAPKLSELNICELTPIVEPIGSGENGLYEFKITPRKGGLGETEVYVNGNLTYSLKPNQLISKKENNNAFYVLKISADSLQQYLSGKKYSSNPLLVKCKVQGSGIYGRGAELVVTKEVDEETPKFYGVFVGVNDYGNPTKESSELRYRDLDYAKKDADDLANAVEATARNLFKEDCHIYRLTATGTGEGVPSKANLQHVLEEIGKEAKASDVLYIFFAGHGDIKQNKGESDIRFVLHKADKKNLTSTSFGVTELAEWCHPKNIKAQKRVFVFDACHSGQLINQTMAFNGRGDEDATRIRQLDNLKDKNGMMILAASADDESAYEDETLNQGVLTYHLLQVIKEQQQDTSLVIRTWFDEAIDLVKEYSSTHGNKQEPNSFGDGRFEIGNITEQVRQGIDITCPKTRIGLCTFVDPTGEAEALYPELKNKVNQYFESTSSRGSLVYSKNLDKAYRIEGSYSKVNSKLQIRYKVFLGDKQMGDAITLLPSKNITEDELVHVITDSIQTQLEQIDKRKEKCEKKY